MDEDALEDGEAGKPCKNKARNLMTREKESQPLRHTPEDPIPPFIELSLLLLVTQNILIYRLEKELHIVKKEHL